MTLNNSNYFFLRGRWYTTSEKHVWILDKCRCVFLSKLLFIWELKQEQQEQRKRELEEKKKKEAERLQKREMEKKKKIDELRKYVTTAFILINIMNFLLLKINV